MRKVFAAVLVMLMALVGMSAAAGAAGVQALSPNNQWIMFSNGYTGFCIDKDDAGTKVGDPYTLHTAHDAISNYYSTADNTVYIDQYLKAAFIFDHDQLFSRYVDSTQGINGGYYDRTLGGKGGVHPGQLCWVFSDKPYLAVNSAMVNDSGAFNTAIGQPISHSAALVNVILNARDRIDNQKMKISDDGVITYADGRVETMYRLSDGTYVDFDFKVMDSDNAETQDFFAFKVTYYRDIEVASGSQAVLDARINPYKVRSYEWSGLDETGSFVDEKQGAYKTEVLNNEDHGKEYRCVFLDKDGSYSHYKTEYVFRIKISGVDDQPTIEWDKKPNGAVPVGKEVELKVDTQNATSVQWYVNKNDNKQQDGNVYQAIPGANSETLTIIASEENEGYSYFCEAKNGTETVQTPTKYTLSLRELVPLTISLTQKPDGAVKDKTSFDLKVTSNSTNLQWYVKESAEGEEKLIIGATSDTLTVTANINEGGNNGHTYFCRATNEDGSADSATFTLTVTPLELPTITLTQKPDGAVKHDTPFTLKVTSNSTNLQWYVKESAEGEERPISGATSDTLTVTANINEGGNNGYTYFCRATNEDGTADSEAFTLTVTEPIVPNTPPYFTSPETDVTVECTEGDSVMLSATATDPDEADIPKLTYAWYEQGSDEPVGTGNTLTISALTLADNGKVYYCVVSDTKETAKSMMFTLKVIKKEVPKADPPVIISPTEFTEMSFIPGETVTMIVVAENADHYQWMVDKGTGTLEEIKGATESSYTTDKLGKENGNWQYVCRVSNDQCDDNVYSRPFVLVAKSAPQMPATGDSSSLALWLGMMLGAVAMLAGLVRGKRAGMGGN